MENNRNAFVGNINRQPGPNWILDAKTWMPGHGALTPKRNGVNRMHDRSPSRLKSGPG